MQAGKAARPTRISLARPACSPAFSRRRASWIVMGPRWPLPGGRRRSPSSAPIMAGTAGRIPACGTLRDKDAQGRPVPHDGTRPRHRICAQGTFRPGTDPGAGRARQPRQVFGLAVGRQSVYRKIIKGRAASAFRRCRVRPPAIIPNSRSSDLGPRRRPSVRRSQAKPCGGAAPGIRGARRWDFRPPGIKPHKGKILQAGAPQTRGNPGAAAERAEPASAEFYAIERR